MRITGKTPKGTPFTVELEGTSSLDCRNLRQAGE